MKLATFTHRGATRIGVVRDDGVVDLSAAAPELPREMTGFLAAGASAMVRAREVAAKAAALPLAEVTLRVEGEDGFVLDGSSNMRLISRDPLELIGQTIGKNHQYPDGFVLFLGTMFAPIDDRGEAGRGFTHKTGDVVTVSTPRLGALTNKVRHCEEVPPWTFGISDLMRNLAGRGLLGA